MGKVLAFTMGFLIIAGTTAWGASDKIDPKTYICAELVAANTDGQPPLFEGLQIDGYLGGQANAKVPDPLAMQSLLIAVSDSCSAKPAEKVLDHWKTLRKHYPWPDERVWNADKTTCADYQGNPDDGSGFIIWLDGYNRGKTGKDVSVLKDQETFDKFLEACKANPQKLILDVIQESAR